MLQFSSLDSYSPKMDGDYTKAEHTYIVATLDNIKEPIITERYSLSDEVKRELYSMPTPFSSAYAECVFLRTYSRKKEDGTKESWADTVIRVVEGTIEAYLTHHKRNGLSVDYKWLADFSAEMARSFFHRRWSPPGRGLFSMGTDHTRRNGNAALNNCYACETKNLVLAASWAMDQLMCGGGVGFDCSWDGVAIPPNKQDCLTFVIPDTRQGWVAAVELLLRAYLPIDGQITNKFPKFDFSLIRPYGKLIKGFGGVASGPEPLKTLLNRIEIFLDTYLEYQAWEKEYEQYPRLLDTIDTVIEYEFMVKKNDIFFRLAKRLHAVGAYTYGDFDKELEELKQALGNYNKSYDKTRLVVDIFNSIGACVIAGNVRRSAEIAIGDAGDQTFLELKNVAVNPERKSISWVSNNTVRFEKHEDFEKYIPEISRRIQNNGEPGFFNLINARKYGRITDTDYGEDTGRLLNPCVTGDTLVMTDEGMQRVDSLIGKPFNVVVNGRLYPSTKEGFWKTGDRECFSISLKNGMKVEATGNHKFLTKRDKTYTWVEVKYLEVDDTLVLSNNTGYSWEGGRGSWEEGYFCGRLIGNGTFDGYIPVVALWVPNNINIEEYPPARTIYNLARKLEHCHDFKEWCVEMTTERYTKYIMKLSSFQKISDKFGISNREKNVPQVNLSYNFTRGLLSGLFDANGSVQVDDQTGLNLRLVQSNLKQLEAVQRLLSSLGIKSTIRREERVRSFPNEIKDYFCWDDDELFITNEDLLTFNELIGFEEPLKQDKLDYELSKYRRASHPIKWESSIERIVPTGSKAVYDCSINEVHCFSANGIMAHNCGEVILNSFEPCTLSTICPSNCKGKNGKIDIDIMLQAARFATFYATTVTCIKHHWGVSNAIIAHNRRIGVSMTGIADIYEEYGFTYLTTICRTLYKEIRSYNAQLAAKAGIPRAIRVTTVKPEGTLSIIMEVNAGVHFPICRFARRRIGIAKNDELLGPLKAAGYPIEESTYSESMVYVIFPIQNGKCRSEREVSIYEQFGIVSALQRSYADNSVSFTGHFSQERENDDVERVIAMFAPQIKSCSMLPYSDDLSKKPIYPHMPFEEIDEKTYNELVATIKPVVWNNIGQDVPIPRGCTNDTCSLG